VQIICKQAFRFADTVISTDAVGNVEAKERSSIIVQPGYRPVEVPEYVKDDPTFKAALAAELIEVLN